MSRRGTRPALLVGLIIAILAVGAGIALAAVIEADNASDYSKPNYLQPQGVRSVFKNTTVVKGGGTPPPSKATGHNVTSDAAFGGFRLFSSDTISPGDSAPVNGTQYLSAGDYPFHCSIHSAMKATLHVTGAGTPVARPELEVTILTKSLIRARLRHSVKVQVEALTTTARGVSLRLERTSNGKRWGGDTDIKVAAGDTRKIRLNLKYRFLKQVTLAIHLHHKIQLKVIAKVPFGTGDDDKQTLS